MIELSPAGFEEVDCGDELELVVYTDAVGEQLLADVFGGVAGTEVEPAWEQRWREFHRPIRVGRLWVGAPWHEQPANGLRVVIEPGRAFGTGAHPSTRLCLRLLQAVPAGSCLDLGCGSGVVAIAAAKLGFDPVIAVDIDEHAVEAVQRNAFANGVALQSFRADVRTTSLPQTDVVVANLTRELVQQILPRLECRVVIAGGYLPTDAIHAVDFRHVERLTEDGWAADLLERAGQ